MKNLKIRNKLMVGFGITIILSIVLAVFAVVALGVISDSYRNKLDFSQVRVQSILEISEEVTELRGITTAILVDYGDMTRMQGHQTESMNAFDTINDHLANYIYLTQNDTALTVNQINALVGKAEVMRASTQQYRRDLVEPNIAFGMAGDLASLSANSTAQAPVIAQVQTIIDEMKAAEYELSYVLKDQSVATANLYRVIFVVVTVLIVIISIGLTFFIANGLSKPLKVVERWMAVTSKGKIVWTHDELRMLDMYSKRRDEVGSMMASYSQLVEYMGTLSKVLSRVAEGDLTIKVVPNSEEDLLSRSLESMLKDLNNMFNEINTASVQVSAGSRQIAEGAQALAQGSTEQAASVQQLSASISEIAGQTKENANMAERAASLAGTIKGKAEKGNQQMSDMMSAVRDINNSSQSISKVIKVIDDIAFQTNILALNAAVEAARAGQHGKGFAVVAEEVRNLAAKSAEAAKDTGGLISDSMEKADLGSRIAEDTAASLSEIVAGIIESSQIISEIASSSEQQYTGISQINSGIDQVAQVVQQNSATAEESAAASEEMSGQSAILEELISRFHLLADANNNRALPINQHPAEQLAAPETAPYLPDGDGCFGNY